MNIHEVQRSTQRYYYQDGLIEIGVGVLFAVIGLAILLVPLLPAHLSWTWGIGLPLLILLGTFGVRALISSLKERVVYPRTGYIAYSEKPSRGRWLIVAGALALAVLSFFLPDELSRMSLAEGVLLALILVYLGYRISLVRLYAAAAVVLLAGLVVTLVGLSDLTGSGALFSIAGLTLVFSGLSGLAAYLQANPQNEDEAME